MRFRSRLALSREQQVQEVGAVLRKEQGKEKGVFCRMDERD